MNLDSPGFSIEPIHRIFSLPENLVWADFLNKVRVHFDVSPGTNLSLESLVAQKVLSKQIEIYLMSQSGELLRLSKKPRDSEDCEIFALHRDIFEGILGWDVGSLQKGVIRYEHDTQDFLSTLKSTPRGVGIFLPPTDLNIVMKRAERGERMPQKSTYFFPKIATGLIVYELGSL